MPNYVTSTLNREETDSRGSAVGIATGLRDGRLGVRMPAGTRQLIRNVHTGSGAHPASYSMHTAVISYAQRVCVCGGGVPVPVAVRSEA